MRSNPAAAQVARKRAIAAFAMPIAAVCLLAGALSTPAAAEEVPRRIVSLAPSVTEIVFALGLGERLVGVSTYCDYPPEARAIDKVGTFVTPAVERIVAKQPDLVIAEPNVGNRSPVESLRRLGLEVLVVDPDTIAQAKETFVVIARRLGVEDRGHELVAQLDRDIAAVVARVRGAKVRRTLLVVGRRPLIVAGGGTVQDELIRLAGGSNVGAEGGAGWPHVSIEHAIASAPEVIIDSSMGGEAGEDEATSFWQGFAAIPAVRAGRVAAYGGGDIFRPGPRLAAALAGIARVIHPERFADE